MPTRPADLSCTCAALRAAARHVTQLYDRALAESGLRTSQHSLLSRLRALGPCSINALAAALAMDRTTLARNLRPLLRAGLLGSAQARDDKRARRLALTAKGSARLAAADARWSRAQAQFERSYGRKRSRDLRELLAAVMALDAPAADGR